MHVIIYVLDALRADHLSCYGYERETSPHIDALAREGVVFENCFTSSTWTRPVAASILTGTYPAVHRTRTRHDMFSTNLTRLPQVLKAGGFETAGFSTIGHLASELGFDEGFDRYYDLFRDPIILAKRRKLDTAKEGLLHAAGQEIALPQAEDVHDFLFPWLEENQATSTLNFIWSIETHIPYIVPNTFRHFSSSSFSQPNEGGYDDLRSATAADRQRIIDLYDDVIRYNDHCIGKIVSHLKALGIYEDTLFVIVSDHGDAFYEHGTYGHGYAPHEELIHVPMVMRFPGGQYGEQRVPGLVELIDIFPTMMAVVGLAPGMVGSTLVQGHNLLPLLDGRRSQVREYVFSDTQALEFHNRYLSVRSQRWKYIQVEQPKRNEPMFASTVKHIIERRMIFDILRAPRHFLRHYFSSTSRYLFNLEADPGEQYNMAAERPDLVSQFQQVLESWQQQNDELAEQAGSAPYSYEESESLRRHLEELGYM